MARNEIGRTVIKSLNLNFYGPEPIYDRLITGKELDDALTWYNYNLDQKEAFKFLLIYLTQKGDANLTKNVKEAGDKFFSFTLGKVARLILNGATLPEYAYKWLDSGLSDGIAKYNRSKLELVVTKAPGKLNETNAIMLGKIEDIIENSTGEKVAPILKEAKASSKTARKVIDYLVEEVKKVNKYCTPEDALVYNKAADRVISEIAFFLDDDTVKPSKAQTVSKPASVKKPRKPRKKKVISAEKKVAKVKYLKEFPELALTSISPKDIIGKTALWYYDVRYQKLVVVRKADGLDIKGTTVIFDEKTSESKKIGRKTKETLDVVLKGGKIALRKIFENIKTGNIEVTGRLSENTILLKVEK